MKNIDDLILNFTQLSGVGHKTATRYVYDILKMPEQKRDEFAQNISNLKKIKECEKCYGYSLNSVCEICSDPTRDSDILIVVAEPKDINKVETILPNAYYYFVLGGIIDPLDGVKLENLHINELEKRIKMENVSEIIFVLPTNNEGELTAAYIKRKINNEDVKFTKLAQGVPIGGDLEYLDELTLLKSIQRRQNY